MEVKLTVVDHYGQRQVIETPELIQFKLEELHQELDKLPLEEVAGYWQSQEKCPDLADDDFHLIFLRCEMFHTKQAAKRLAQYWNTRIELFGKDKAFLPLTLGMGLKDDGESIRLGIIRLVGTHDLSGRNIVFYDPSRLPTDRNYSRTGVLRAVWYVMHAALEEEATQKKGVVFMPHPRHFQLFQFDRQLLQLVIESIRGILPVRMAAIHVCHPPWFFRMVWNFVKPMLGTRLRQRLRVHIGSESTVLARLHEQGLVAKVLPKDIGGRVELNSEHWIRERRKAGK